MAEWLIVGLGNPGAEYDLTRHNMGFMLVDRLAAQEGVGVKRTECRSLIGRAIIEERLAELVKPQTFMNLSGEAVKCLLEKQERSGRVLIAITDDLALPFGKIRIRAEGSHGGHNGLRSMIERLGTSKFIRLRIGIAPEHQISDPKSFVLQKFGRSELDELDQILAKGVEAVRWVIRKGVDKAMAEFN